MGYHYVICVDGTIQKGRPLANIGSHCFDAGKNHTSIGVCYIGGMDVANKKSKDTRTKKQKEAIELLVKNLVEMYPQLKKLSGHNQYAKKDCPSFDVSKEYSELAKFLNLEL